MNATKHLTALCAAFLFACSTDSPDVTGVTVVDNTMAQNESSSSENVSSSSEMETSSSSIKTPSSSSQEDKKSSSSGIVIPPKASCKPPALTHTVTFGVVDAFIQKRVDVLKNLGLDQEAAKDSATEELYRELGLDTLFVDRPMITDDQLEYTLYYLYKSSEHANELSPDIVEDFADGTLDTTNFCVLDTSFEALDNMPFEYMDLGCFIGYELPNTIAILRNIWRKCHDMPYCNESIKDTVIPVGNDHFVCEGAYWTTLEIQGKMKNGVLCDENGTRVEDNGTYICYEGYWRSMTQTQDMPAEYFFNPDFEYGSFTDSRDGHVYKTITFVDGGNTRTMFAQNLNYGTFVKLGEESDAEVQKHCYDDDEWYCDHFFGGLYTWSEAFGLPRACDMIPTGSSVECPDTIWTTAQLNGWRTIKKSLWKGLCPEGWHILTENEWVTAGVQQITGANNKTGTSLLAAGYAEDDPIKQRGDSSVYKYERTAFWLSSDVYGIDSIGANIAMSWFITSHPLVNEATVRSNRFRKTAALSIRCITD